MLCWALGLSQTSQSFTPRIPSPLNLLARSPPPCRARSSPVLARAMSHWGRYRILQGRASGIATEVLEDVAVEHLNLSGHTESIIQREYLTLPHEKAHMPSTKFDTILPRSDSSTALPSANSVPGPAYYVCLPRFADLLSTATCLMSIYLGVHYCYHGVSPCSRISLCQPYQSLTFRISRHAPEDLLCI